MSGCATRINTKEDVESLLEGIKYILLDIDGVIWAGDCVFPQIPETLKWLLKDRQKQLRFMTNNSMHTRTATAEKFARKGIDFVKENMIYTSAYVAALKLQELAKQENNNNNKYSKNVFVIGERGLHQEIRSAALAPGVTTYGYELVPQPHDAFMSHYTPYGVVRAVKEKCLPDTSSQLDDPNTDNGDNKKRLSVEDMNIGAIVCGLDCNLNNFKMAVAGMADHISQKKGNGKLPYIATNTDPQLPGEGGFPLPGCGTGLAALTTLLGRQPDVVCGKPYVHMAKLLFAKEGTDPKSCLMVGDRLTTDIAFGRAAGCKTLLVLTGCEGLKDVEKVSEECRPDYVADSLATLFVASE